MLQVRSIRRNDVCFGFLAFILATCSITYALATKSLPLWLYIISSLSISIISVVYALFLKGSRKFVSYFFIIVLALILRNIYGLGTQYQVIPLRDSYMEFVGFRLMLDSGHVNIGYIPKELWISPANSAYYPIFSLLATSFVLITGIDILKVCYVLPICISFFAFFCVALFVRNLMPNSKTKDLALSAAMLIFAVSPSMVYNGICFYHRVLAQSFLFLLLYLLLKHFTDNPSIKLGSLLVFTGAFLTLAHSSVPAYSSIITFTFTVLAYLIYLVYKPAFMNLKNLKSLSRLSIIFFAMFFLYNFIVFISSPVTGGLPIYLNNILRNIIYPEYASKVETTLSVPSIMPEVLVPMPWIYLPRIRALLLDIPLPVIGAFLTYKLIKKKISKEELLALLFIISFLPLILIRIISWSNVFIFRSFAYPVIAYSVCFLLLSSIRSKRKFVKTMAATVVVFLVFVSFLAPWESYFPRHFYDPNVSYKEADFPHPSYIHLKEIINSHSLSEGTLMSDLPELLTVILPLERIKDIKSLEDFYGQPHSYIIEFVELKVGASTGDISPGLEIIAQKRSLIKSEINNDYARVFDARFYRVYFSP